MDAPDVNSKSQLGALSSAASAGETQPSDSTEEKESPPLTTTVINLGRLEVPEEELDILALVHRLPGVEQVWTEMEALTIVHDANQVTREAIVDVLTRRGFQVEAV